jgi:hypothetical protein
VNVSLRAQAPPDPNYAPPPGYQPQPSYPTPAPSSSYPYQAPPAYPNQAPQQQAQAPVLTPQDLSNLVAPIALYPDMLLSQVLAASTYPLELVQAEQWMQANPALRGPALVDAAKQQNWDPSVQALVAFPDVLSRLASNIQWTTALGNAFLAQQADVMDAIQQLRAEARANGRLADTEQERVVVDQQNGQSAIEIQPANPQVVYAPVYNPAYVWGPPVYGAYPVIAYPPIGYGIYYAVGTFLGALFSGLLAFGGWGWGLSWFAHGLFLTTLFFSHFGFHGWGGAGYFAGRGYGAHVAWMHDPAHRLGVPYSNRAVAGRFGGGFGARGGFEGRGGFGGGFAGRGGFAGNERNSYGNRSFESGRSGYGSGIAGANRQAEAYRGLTARESRGSGFNGSGFNGYGSGYRSAPNYSRDAARENSARSYGAQSYGRQAARGGYEQSARSFRSSESRGSSGHFSSRYSAPKSSGHFGGGGHSGGHSHLGGHGHSGGHSGGGGHSHGHHK